MAPQRLHVGACALRRYEQRGHLVRFSQRFAVETCHAARESRAAPRGGGEEGERQDRQGLAALCVAAGLEARVPGVSAGQLAHVCAEC